MTGTVIMLAFLLQSASQLPAPPAPPPPVHTFEERWEPVKRLPPMIDMTRGGIQSYPLTRPPQLDPMIPLPAPVPTEIKVRTIEIRKLPPADEVSTVDTPPPPMPRARPEVAAPQPTPPLRRARLASLDLCQRHGMRKEITRGGKSWRCRR